MDEEDDDVPWASPEIQRGYEAALGRFLLAFNRLDNRLTEIVAFALSKLKREDLIKPSTRKGFSVKLDTLDLLKTSGEGRKLADVPIELMRQINNERNVLAHGHFDQNPYDGRYEVVTIRVRKEYSVEKIGGLTEKADRAFDMLATVVAQYEFDDEP